MLRSAGSRSCGHHHRGSNAVAPPGKEHYKVVLVGDDGVGKSSLISTALTLEFLVSVPSVVDNAVITECIGGHQTTVNVWDTPGDLKYDRLRPLSYRNADIIVICFSVANTGSFENVARKWIPEIQHFCPTIPYIILGTQTDLRKTTELRHDDHIQGPVTTEEGRQYAMSVGARCYLECSALCNQNLHCLFSAFVVSSMPREPTEEHYGLK
ncbi:Rho family GTPase [Pelomyxa schiedti]|nr:Rho family GTPase [Pelomyxa schiedti]